MLARFAHWLPPEGAQFAPWDVPAALKRALLNESRVGELCQVGHLLDDPELEQQVG